MTIKDIAQMSATELEGLSTKELQKVANRLVDASNKRLKRLEEKGLHHSSTAYQKRATKATRVKNKGYTTKFTSNVLKIKSDTGKRNRLKQVIALTRSFLADKTSTIKGAKEQATMIMEKSGITMNDFFFFKNGKPKKGRLREFWKAYNRFKEEHIKQNPNDWETGSPIEIVEEFFEDVYKRNADKKGRLKISTIEEEVIKGYERKEGKESRVPAKGSGILERVDSPRGASQRKTNGGVKSIESYSVASANSKKTRKPKK